MIEGNNFRALIDTGCSVSLLRSDLLQHLPNSKSDIVLKTINSNCIRTEGRVHVSSVILQGVDLGPVDFYKVPTLPLGVHAVLGLDVLAHCGLQLSFQNGRPSVKFLSNATVFYGSPESESVMLPSLPNNQESTRELQVEAKETVSLSDRDFEAKFDGQQWSVKWKWKNDPPPVNIRRVNYKVSQTDLKEFDAEISLWVSEGILIPWDFNEHGDIKNVLPLISVRQQKGEVTKVRPVLDFRFLNDYVLSLTGAAMPLCQERLREWRRYGQNCSVLDLRKAYLQIRIDPSLWCYQAIKWNGKVYLLTRLGFGLNIAPKVMTRIVERVLKDDETISRATSSYIDDIFVNEDIAEADTVVQHLKKFHLKTKPCERFGSPEGVRVLGLRVDDGMQWKRDGPLSTITGQQLTRREVHKVLGEWVGHLPVCGWLRVACAYMQRCTAKDGVKWDEFVSESTMQKLMDIEDRLRREGDPAHGRWVVKMGAKATIWTDASSIATGVALSYDDDIVEDAAWLRKDSDTAHINICELDAAIRGINLALRWNEKTFTLKTDSFTVFRWLKSALEDTHNVRTHALGEHLIRRRLDLVRELKHQEGLQVNVELVRSAENKADGLTRVPRKWITVKEVAAAAAVGQIIKPTVKDIIDIHQKNHFGTDRTFELVAARFGEAVSREEVKSIVDQCEKCARICPSARNRYKKGNLSTSRIWFRLSTDITHIGRESYLTVIDNSSRFCIWRKLPNETSKAVSFQLQQIFSEMGPPEYLLSDNGTVFRSKEIQELMLKWGIIHQKSCAYRPQGNGMIERNHRTIKTINARSGNDVTECAFWYNVTNGRRKASPYELVYHAKAKLPYIREHRENHCVEDSTDDEKQELENAAEKNPFVVGDYVFLRSSGRCNDQWTGPHRVTNVNNEVSLEINDDGVSRHVSHVRRVPTAKVTTENNSMESDTSSENEDEEIPMDQASSPNTDEEDMHETEITREEDITIPARETTVSRRSSRMRQRPGYLNDYIAN